MRLGNILHVIGFRLNQVHVPDDTFRVFVDHLCRLIRGKNFVLQGSRYTWGKQVQAFLQSPIPVEKERQIWSNTKGGFGARDVWDMLRSCGARCVSTEVSQQERDAHLYSLFVLAALVVPVSKTLLGGEYGNRVARALRRSLETHAPETQRIPVQVGNGKCIFEPFSVFFRRIEGSTKTDFECYLNCLTTTLRLPAEKVYNGVLAHFVHWSGGASVAYKKTLSLDQVVRIIMSTPAQAKKYLEFCKTQKQIQVSLDDHSTTRVNIDLEETFSSYTSLNRILKQCTSPNIVACPKQCCVDVLTTAFAEAEFNWEHP
jgi:hypothetical protein